MSERLTNGPGVVTPPCRTTCTVCGSVPGQNRSVRRSQLEFDLDCGRSLGHLRRVSLIQRAYCAAAVSITHCDVREVYQPSGTGLAGRLPQADT
jgi:hypothetical protein